MNKRKVGEIVKFYIQKNIQNKWFIAVNIIILIFMLISTNASNIRSYLESKDIDLFDESFKIELIDNENLAKSEIYQAFEENSNITIEEVNENNYTKENISKDIAIIEIKSDDEKIISAKITTKEGMDGTLYNTILKALQEARKNIFSTKTGIDRNDIDLINSDVEVERVLLGANAENSDQKEMIKYVSTFVVYMISIFIFSKIANEIAQEKVSKSIEYVLTSVTAEEYLLAKIISVMSIVLIQLVYTIVYYFIGNLISNLITMSVTSTNAINIISSLDKDIVQYILLVFVYAFLNLILMSIIQAALSSKTTSMSEAGNSVMFLMIITIFAYFMTMALITPYTNMSVGLYVLSCLPLLSNYFVPAIIVIGQATTLQIVISILLLIISIPITFKFCAKILKNGVLDYSNKKIKRNEKTLEIEQKILAQKAKFKRFSFVIGFSVLIYIVLQIVIELLMQFLVVPLLPKSLDNLNIQLIVLGVVSIVSLFSAYKIVNLYTENTSSTKLRLTKKSIAKIIILGISMLCIIQVLTNIIYEIIGIDYNIIDSIDITQNITFITGCLYIIVTALIPAIFEELFFRKGIINISKKYGEIFAILISAFIFGIAHMNLGQFIFAFMVGILLGIIYCKTNNLKITIILHFFNNAYAGITSILLVKNILSMKNYVKFEKIFVILCIWVAILFLIDYLRKNYKKLIEKFEDFKNDDTKIEDSKIFTYKYILFDYTLIISLALIVCLFAVTENMLSN